MYWLDELRDFSVMFRSAATMGFKVGTSGMLRLNPAKITPVMAGRVWNRLDAMEAEKHPKGSAPSWFLPVISQCLFALLLTVDCRFQL